MTFKRTIRNLLAAASEPANRKAVRAAWAEATAAAWREAQRAMDERCTEAVMRLSEEEFERLFAEEQAKVEAICKPLKHAAERDLWPKHLHWARSKKSSEDALARIDKVARFVNYG